MLCPNCTAGAHDLCTFCACASKKRLAKKRCRHERNSWLIAGGYYEWCYVCGAFRKLRKIGPNSCVVDGPWQRPSGDPKVNPEIAQGSLRTRRGARGSLRPA